MILLITTSGISINGISLVVSPAVYQVVATVDTAIPAAPMKRPAAARRGASKAKLAERRRSDDAVADAAADTGVQIRCADWSESVMHSHTSSTSARGPLHIPGADDAGGQPRQRKRARVPSGGGLGAVAAEDADHDDDVVQIVSCRDADPEGAAALHSVGVSWCRHALTSD